MKKYFLGAMISTTIIFTSIYFYSSVSNTKAAETKSENNISETQTKTYPVPLPDKISFCGEPVPLSEPDIRERLDRELLVNTYWQSQTLLIIKEYNKIRPLLEPVLKKYNMPADLIFLAAAESGFKNVVSSSNAVGVWQLLNETGKLYGLEINAEVDQRYHYEKSTEAACLYLKSAYDKFGSWSMAACSYNMGMSGTATAIEKQKAKSYYDLSLTQEPSRYVFRILALKEILNNPSKYGFILNETDLYQPYSYKTIMVDSSISSLADFSADENINYKKLKILNPWLRASVLTNKYKKQYEIKIMN
ncbi:MAG: lytic transglycosylase domain-containing protein [Ignavibacteria bacterium]|nr:lytic transglycosylase domain-containing protein [Ignavibacteria bacterium]